MCEVALSSCRDCNIADSVPRRERTDGLILHVTLGSHIGVHNPANIARPGFTKGGAGSADAAVRRAKLGEFASADCGCARSVVGRLRKYGAITRLSRYLLQGARNKPHCWTGPPRRIQSNQQWHTSERTQRRSARCNRSNCQRARMYRLNIFRD